MRNQRQKLIAINGLLFAALLLAGGAAWAQVVGVVAHLSGPLIAKRANGSIKVLAAKSEVENGDTLVSENNTYAQIQFIDHGEITLRPNTTFRIENFAYDASKPENDSARFDLVKGGLRSITGLLGKRNKARFAMKTPSATIGIRGTTFIAQYVPPPSMTVSYDPSPIAGGGAGTQAGASAAKRPIDRSPDGSGASGGSTGKAGQPGQDLAAHAALVIANAMNGLAAGVHDVGAPPAPPGGISRQPVDQGSVGVNPTAGGVGGPGMPQPPGAPVLAPGLHLQVTDGAIVVTNNGGALGFQAGQFGYVPNPNQPPVIVPPNPGIQFVPPPSFNPGSGGPTASSGSGNAPATDCVVR